MDNAEIVRLLTEQQQFIERLAEKVSILEERIYTDHNIRDTYSNHISSYTHEPNRMMNNSYIPPLENDYYTIYEFHEAGQQVATLSTPDLEKLINTVGLLRQSIKELGDLEVLKNNICNMAVEADQMQADMIKIINEEGNKAVNKIKDLASITDSAQIDNKDLILDKDE